MPDTTAIRSTLSMESGGMFIAIKLVSIISLIMLALFSRGVRAGLVVIILVVPLWLFVEMVMSDTGPSPFWKSFEKREEFSRLPLENDIDKMKGARKGQKVKQAILEGRLKEQVFYTLKNEYNLSEEEVKVLDEDPVSMADKIDNEELIEYLKNARDLKDFKDPNSGGRDARTLEFEDKMKSAVSELERIHYVKESGGE